MLQVADPFLPPTIYIYVLQDKRMQLFNDYMDHGKDFAKVEALFQSRLEESQKTSVKYGFRNDQWLKKHHGEKKAEKIMARKKSLGLKLVSNIAIPITFPALALKVCMYPVPIYSCQGRWRTRSSLVRMSTCTLSWWSSTSKISRS